MQPDASSKILESSASTNPFHHPAPPPSLPSKAKMLSPASQDQLEAGFCGEISLPALLILLAVVLLFQFCCEEQDHRKITSEQNEEKEMDSDSPHWTAELELDGVCHQFYFLCGSLQLWV